MFVFEAERLERNGLTKPSHFSGNGSPVGSDDRVVTASAGVQGELPLVAGNGDEEI
jgi:hypothetical protein